MNLSLRSCEIAEITLSDNKIIHESNIYADDRDEYIAAFRRQVFQLLKWGYERLDLSKYKSSQEEVITGELAKEINNLVQDRRYPGWVGRFYVHEEFRINDAHRVGKNRKRIDIKILYIQHGPRPYYPFEAKRLSAKGHPINRYLGAEGLGEFLSGSYGRDVSEGGMIGFVQTGSIEQWAIKTQKKIHKSPIDFKLCNQEKCMFVKIVDGLDFCYLSMHNRENGYSPISIYHLFLSFS